MEDYLLELQHSLLQLEIENENLRRQLETKDTLLRNTTNALLYNDIDMGKPRSEKRCLQRAKWKYYRDKKMSYSKMTWREIKKETDRLFDSLEDVEKDRYLCL
jgi:CRISPR/Cas system CMR subunit Cmr4 (Cas7 group RAMP superfamily)